MSALRSLRENVHWLVLVPFAILVLWLILRVVVLLVIGVALFAAWYWVFRKTRTPLPPASVRDYDRIRAEDDNRAIDDRP